MQPSDAGVVLQVYGKGGKTRYVLISEGTYQELAGLGGTRRPNAPVFVSRRGGPLDASQGLRIIEAAAKRAGLPAECRRTGCAMPTPYMPSIAARRSASCRQHSAMPRCRRSARMCTPDRMQAAGAL